MAGFSLGCNNNTEDFHRSAMKFPAFGRRPEFPPRFSTVERVPEFHLVSPPQWDMGDLVEENAKIRLELRRNGGHRGKVSQEILSWLDAFERTEEMHRLEVPLRWDCVCPKNASALLVSYRKSVVDRTTEQLVSPTLVGKSAQSISNQVCDYLADPMIETIGLYGEGGVGKTTIMKNLNNLLLNTDMFDKIIWVTLSQSATIQSVQDQLALQLGIALPTKGKGRSELFEWNRASVIRGTLVNLGKCLIILDDMWDALSLSSIGIPEQPTCNYKVVLTTRSSQICWQMRAQKQICVSPLSEHEAWDLFVSRSGDHVLNSKIRKIAQKIVYECRGLPITVITIAHAMRQEVSTIAWRHALKDIRSTYNVDVDKRISDLLRFGYSHLKKTRVKNCFLYCALFPEDFLFEARELIQYWIAEELICKESIAASIDEGYQILKEITNANMLEPVMRGGDTWVRMHDLFRDLAVSIMTQELGFLVQAGQRLTELGDLLTNKKLASLIRNEIEDLHFHDGWAATTDLSTLLLRDNPLSHISDINLFGRLHNLQVLDMSYTGIIELPDSINQLSKLRVLFLQYCTSLENLSILIYCKKLQFLNLCGTLIKELPPGMEKLVQLRSLDLSETVRLENIQEGFISSLSNLEELQMQGSLLCKLESPTIADRLKEIRCLKKLAILTLSAVGFDDHLDTILHLQRHSLTSFSINVYGSTQDYNEDV